MKPSILIALTLVCCLAAAQHLHAQAPAAGSSQNKAADSRQKPAANSQKSGGTGTAANPFPEDTSSVPVVPTSPAAPAPNLGSDNSEIKLPGTDTDPVRSPDEPLASSESADQGGSSSSLQGIGQLLPVPGADEPETKQPTHQVTAKEDISVGSFYLDQKNWRGALSRFESALVLDPENSEVYWGLAECQRHLGQYAEAKLNYVKVVEYDPSSKHSKDAKKYLKDPEIANAPAPSPSAPNR